MLRRLHRMVLGCLLFASMSIGSLSWAGQSNYQLMYVFGDSLSDTGNDFLATTSMGLQPAIPPSVSPFATYWQGRFSNGPVAVEYLWGLVQKKAGTEVAPSLTATPSPTRSAVSFAYGGSTSGGYAMTPLGFAAPGLLTQTQLFQAALGAGKAPTNALYVVWSGANDYLQPLPTEPPVDPAVVVANIVQAVRNLHMLGARSFLIPNLPDLGLTPFVQVQGRAAGATQLSMLHNGLLSAALTALANEIPSLRIVTVDVFALGSSLVASGQVTTVPPALEFLAPGTGAVDCLFRAPATCIDVSLSAYLPPFLFWDVMHPTTQVHALIGTAMYSALLQQR